MAHLGPKETLNDDRIASRLRALLRTMLCRTGFRCRSRFWLLRALYHHIDNLCERNVIAIDTTNLRKQVLRLLRQLTRNPAGSDGSNWTALPSQ